MDTDTKQEINERKGELDTLPASFPSWFLSMAESLPLLVLFAIVVLLAAPFVMVFGALYPIFKPPMGG